MQMHSRGTHSSIPNSLWISQQQRLDYKCNFLELGLRVIIIINFIIHDCLAIFAISTVVAAAASLLLIFCALNTHHRLYYSKMGGTDKESLIIPPRRVAIEKLYRIPLFVHNLCKVQWLSSTTELA